MWKISQGILGQARTGRSGSWLDEDPRSSSPQGVDQLSEIKPLGRLQYDRIGDSITGQWNRLGGGGGMKCDSANRRMDRPVVQCVVSVTNL